MHAILVGVRGGMWMSAPFFEMHAPNKDRLIEMLREINNETGIVITIASDLQLACIIFQK